MSCGAVRSWLHRDTESLSEPERLVLEEHLGGCERCRSERDQLLRVRRVGATLPAQSIGPRGHQRAIARALMQGAAHASSPRRSVPWWAFVAGGALAVAATVLVIVPRSGGVESGSPSPTVGPPPEHLSSAPERTVENVPVADAVIAPDVVLIGGTLTQGNAALTTNSAVPANVTLHAKTDVKLRAYSIDVVVAANSEIRQSPVERSILLERGRVELDGRGSRTVAARFTVESDGIVTVTPKRVSVSRGVARVVGTDGKVLVVVEAGQSWEWTDTRPAKTSAGTLLEQARASFTARDYATAERHADAALDASPSRTQAAEARTILAECAQVTGRLDEALARYEAIATRFGDLPAGETALFAAARLEANRNHLEAAQQLLQRYLDRYPTGRFADDARRQLRAP